MAELSVLGIIPARAGSKGIPHKNTRQLRGKPLIHWAANALMKAKRVNTRMCSTDGEEIADCVKQVGFEVPWLRPAELATDTSSTVDVIAHALRRYQEQQIHFTHVALVQATSPTVLADDIDAAIELAIEKNADTIISGFYSHHSHPSLMYTTDSDQQVHWLLPESERKSRRQDFSTVYIRTGLVYVARADIVLEKHSLYGERIFALEIPESRSITIDEERDFKLAALMLDEMNND